jgi:hypothetical protein
MISNNSDNFHKDTSINVINVSINEERSTNLAKLLTGANSQWKGYWVKVEQDYRIVSYTRWPGCSKNLPTTLYADAMIVEVENEEEFKTVEEYVRSRGRVPFIIFYSEFDFSIIAGTFKHSNAKWVKKSENSGEQLKERIVSGFHEVNKVIKEVFDKFDTNKNGCIEKEEIHNASVELGENVSSEEFLQCFKVMDENNDGVISFDEFQTWWKLGRQSSQIMKRLVQLQMISSNLHANVLEHLQKELEEVKSTEKSLSKHYIKFYSENVENPGLQLLLNAMKGPERIETLHAYLLRFSNHTRVQHSRFIDLVFTLEESTNKNEFLEYAKGMLGMVVAMISSLDSNFEEVFRMFIVMEYFTGVNENSVVLRFRQKVDSQKLVDNAIAPVLNILKLISGNQQLLFDFKNKLSIKEIFEGNLTALEALAKYSLELKVNVQREHLRRIARNHPGAMLLTAPHDLQLLCHLDLEKLVPDQARPLFNQPLGMYKQVLDGILSMAGDTSFLSNVISIEVNFNAYDLFAEIKVKVPGLFN